MPPPASLITRPDLRTLLSTLRLPVLGAPMRKVSGPDLVVAQCRAGVLGAFPALNAHPPQELERWLTVIAAGCGTAPYGVNVSLHPSNERRNADLAQCEAHGVPVVITSMRPPGAIVRQVRAYGGIVLHQALTVDHAMRAVDAGADGIIAVTHGSGGHGGQANPFALVNEIRSFYEGPLGLSGCIAHGKDILAARAMGCDFVSMGTAFITAAESLASDRYRRGVLDASLQDVLAQAMVPHADTADDILPGHGVGGVQESLAVEQLIDQWAEEYVAARRML